MAADGHVSLVDRNVRISKSARLHALHTDVRPNSPPTAADDAATTAEDTAVTAYVLRNDLDTDGDSLTLAITSGPSNGTAAVNADGSISYSPNGNFNGADSLAYSVSDGHGGVDAAVLGLMVTATNDAPVAEDDGATTAEDTRISIAIAAILSNDVDVDNDGLSIQSVASGVNGTVVLAGSNLVFTPNANANGSGSFTYTVTDGHGGTDTAVVSVAITSVNDAPVAQSDEAWVGAGTFPAINVLGNDRDIDGALDPTTVAIVQAPGRGVTVVERGWYGRLFACFQL